MDAVAVEPDQQKLIKNAPCSQNCFYFHELRKMKIEMTWLYFLEIEHVPLYLFEFVYHFTAIWVKWSLESNNKLHNKVEIVTLKTFI